VQSDRIAICFNYPESRRKTEFKRIELKEVPERTEEVEESQLREAEGGIQLPLHLEQSPKANLVSARNRFNSFNIAEDFKKNKSIELARDHGRST
jgi:hypothetical protein